MLAMQKGLFSKFMPFMRHMIKIQIKCVRSNIFFFCQYTIKIDGLILNKLSSMSYITKISYFILSYEIVRKYILNYNI